jgi:hypothetical protein
MSELPDVSWPAPQRMRAACFLIAKAERSFREMHPMLMINCLRTARILLSQSTPFLEINRLQVLEDLEGIDWEPKG